MQIIRRVALAVLVSTAVVATAPRANSEPAEPLSPLVELTLDRLMTADAVAAAKWGTPSPIDDPAREAQVYDAMSALGAQEGLPTDWVRAVFSGQIEANKIVQRGLHSWWRFDPGSAPVSKPDLTAVRPEIDAINAAIIDQLAEHRDELAGPACAVGLSRSVFGVVTSGRADALHQAALVRAAASLCR